MDHAAEIRSRNNPLEGPRRGAPGASALARYLPTLVGIGVAGIGVTALVGWYLGSVALTRVLPSLAPVRVSTAGGLVLCGLALLALELGARRIAAVLGAIVAALAGLLFLQHLAGFDLGIEALIWRPAPLRGVYRPSRMTENAALAFLFIGLAVVGQARRRFQFTSALLGALAFTLGGVVLIGYLAGVPETFAWGVYSDMALLSSIGCVLLGVGVVTLAFRGQQAGTRTIWWGPLLAGAATALAGVLLWQGLLSQQSEHQRQIVNAAGLALRNEIESKVGLMRGVLEYVGAYAAEQGWRTIEDWRGDRLPGLDVFPEVESIEWLAAGVNFGAVYLRSGATAPVVDDPDYRLVVEEAQEYVLVGDGPAVIGPVLFANGDAGFQIFLPVGDNGPMRPVLAGSYRAAPLFGGPPVLAGIESQLQVVLLCEGREVYRLREEPLGDLETRIVRQPLDLPGPRSWELVVAPLAAYRPGGDSHLPEVMLGVSLMIAVLLALTAQFGRVETARAGQLDTAVQERTAELEKVLTDLREAKAEAESANAAKDRFINVLGHELRNPLGAIQSAAEVLTLQLAEAADEKTLSVLQRQVGHLARIIDDLLDVSRIATGQLRIRTQRVDLVAVVREAVEAQRMRIESAGLELDVDEPGEPLWVEADPTRLNQVIDNLLSNAVKFTQPGGRIQIALAATGGGDRARVAVRDTGRGFEAKERRSIFEPFVQGEPATAGPASLGLGLGLPIVKGLVQAHGGDIEAFSEGPGRGAEFVFDLPLREAPAALPARRAGVQPSAQGKRVLLIEDHRDSADMLSQLLELSGYAVDVCYDGQRGVEAARQRPPDVIVCDLGLPGLDGYAVARKLKDDDRTAAIPMIALSGYGQEQHVRRAQESGFSQHLLKPVSPRELERVLESVLEQPSPAEPHPGR